MESEYRYRIVLLDFGHPMNNSTIRNIINSLENVIALRLTFLQDPNQTNFGILILNSEFRIFQPESNLKTNYDLIFKNLRAASEKVNSKVTVQEYKYLLQSSIETALGEFQGKKETGHSIKSSNWLIQFAVLTKKSASVLADILADVTNKLQKNNSNVASIKNFKIIQILNEYQDNPCRNSFNNTSINWTFCPDNLKDLNYFFKGWLLTRQQELRILLSSDLKLEIKCDVYDCVANPISFIFEGILKPINNLEITNRLPVNGLCPTLVFGTPLQIYATRSSSLSETELQVNSKIFKELCRELNRVSQGLLAKSVIPTEKDELISFHLLTSVHRINITADGNMLLMNYVASEELYLPKRIRSSYSVDSSGEESAASAIKSCFQKIQFLDEYNPGNFSSGVYEYLKKNLVKRGQRKRLFGHSDPNVKSFKKKKTKNENLKNSPKMINFSNDIESFIFNARENQKNKIKPGSDKTFQNVHPALLSPNIVEKYRKVPSHAFNLSELGEEYHDSIR